MIIRRPLLALAILIMAFAGCAAPNQNDAWRQATTTINATSPMASRITGFYVQNGQRHEIASDLPFTLTQTGLSEVEIRKVNLNDTVTLETRCEHPERKLSFANMAAGPGVPGVRVELRKGFSVENLKK